MQTDMRGFRVALVADELINSAPPDLDALSVLERAGWGTIVLPPSWYPDEVAAQLLDQVAEHIEEFVRHGYEVVCIGSPEALGDPLERLGVATPDWVTPTGEAELLEFLARRRGAKPS
jgi:hypothetical protein